jgi:hypothetical protein
VCHDDWINEDSICQCNKVSLDVPVECRPLAEFEGENRELFLRAFLHFGASLMGDFKTGNTAIDRDNEDGENERFALRSILQRALFAAYESMELLGVQPKPTATRLFSEELSK